LNEIVHVLFSFFPFIVWFFQTKSSAISYWSCTRI